MQCGFGVSSGSCDLATRRLGSRGDRNLSLGVARADLVDGFACAIGGYTSARFARLIPQPVLRGIVIGIGFTMAGWYFWKTR